MDIRIKRIFNKGKGKGNGKSSSSDPGPANDTPDLDRGGNPVRFEPDTGVNESPVALEETQYVIASQSSILISRLYIAYC